MDAEEFVPQVVAGPQQLSEHVHAFAAREKCQRRIQKLIVRGFRDPIHELVEVSHGLCRVWRFPQVACELFDHRNRQSQPLLFAEISDAVGVGQSSRARLKFGVEFFDADNDGDEDLQIANGHI